MLDKGLGARQIRPMDAARDTAALREMLHAARRVVVFTGAGISTESGIPDFRGPNGTWAQMRPILFQDFLASPEARREAWRRRFESDPVMRAAQPNRGHRAVALLVRQGKASSVITQNIDGLHQASGIPEDRVIELHGNSTYAHCLDCGARHEIAALHEAFLREGDVPDCAACGGLVKTATISFGQAMPEEAMARAQQETLAADLFLVLGSSLVVYPAAGFPEIAKRNGARLVIVNRQDTPLDDIADLVIRHGIGEVMGGAVGVN
ncbi:SIR2 family NAD-dependent protein deacylase [Neoroseomonas alkaliterrae]|nr:Sir2 family NAD-dependent protein deacetylase [Neoroseomonas alkaliterrae]